MNYPVLKRTRRCAFSWIWISVILWCCCTVLCDVIPDLITTNFELDGGTHDVQSDVLVAKKGTLVLRPGVKLRFAPGVGITIKGTLLAQGIPSNRIILERLQSDSSLPKGHPPVRLVDGETPLQGRLQIYFKNHWHSVCTQSKNWSQTDASVLCSQMGLGVGSFHQWWDRSNGSRQMALAEPRCSGNETSVQECAGWVDMMQGSGVCEYHQDLGLRCDANVTQEHLKGNWRGLYFQYAETSQQQLWGKTVTRKVSRSALEYVSIFDAGVDGVGRVTPALRTMGVPPQMNGLEVKRSAMGGANFTYPDEAFDIIDSVFADNRGYGIFVNTSVGQVSLTSTTVTNNGGDGVRYVFHNREQSSDKRFCQFSSLGRFQSFPLILTHKQERSIGAEPPCLQTLEVSGREEGQTLTAHFPVIISDAWDSRESGWMDIFDGASTSALRLASFPLLNDTRPPSVAGTTNTLTLRFRRPHNRSLLFTVEIVADFGKAYDLNLTDCQIKDNTGRGVAVENQRVGVIVNRTSITGSSHVAGLHVMGGSGDVLLNNSKITHNFADGVNVTHAGGFKMFERSVITHNSGHGIAVWINETDLAFNFTSHLVHCVVQENTGYGVLIGNVCRSDAFWNVSSNTFRANRKSAVFFTSCWDEDRARITELLVNHNRFESSDHLSLEISPALHLKATIEYNIFTGHHRGALLIASRGLFRHRKVPCTIVVQQNEFQRNRGTFVANIGVVQDSSQELIFTKNRLFENTVAEAYPSLRPRSRVAAVLVVSSSNAIVLRNSLTNSESTFEMGTHLEAHNRVIDASKNYWGISNPKAAIQVYDRIFDRKDRYNLARIEFRQYITLSSDLNTVTAFSEIEQRDTITEFVKGNEIGGEVMGYVELDRLTYKVKRDIYVTTHSELVVPPGAVLEFDQSLGIMVQGRLQSVGDANSKIKYTVSTEGGGGPTLVGGNVRLSNKTEGRLEVRIGNTWGGVCLYGWDMEDAAVVCQQMGLVLNSQDWLLERSQFTSPENTVNVILSNVKCSEIDTDVTQCEAEQADDISNSCAFEVGIRCFRAAWAGIRLGMEAQESNINHVIIEKAGVVDYATHQFRAALQLDFNRHNVANIKVQDSSHSGLGVMWNDIFYRPENRKVIAGEFVSNARHGVETRSQGLDLLRSTFSSNGGSGLHYDPMFTWIEQHDLITWINYTNSQTYIEIDDSTPQNKNFQIPPDNARYFVFKGKDKRQIDFKVSTSFGNHLGILVLSPFSDMSTEQVVIYGRLEITPDAPLWDVTINSTSFPLRNPGSGIAVRYFPGYQPDGTAIVYISSLKGGRSDRGPEAFFPSTRVLESTFTKCGHAISSFHYNRNISVQGDHYHRYANETILVQDCVISETRDHPVYINTPHWDPDEHNLAEINYTFIRNKIQGCNGGIVQFNRDIRNSNNLFHWTLNYTNFENNVQGGVNIRLPYVWQYSFNYTHTVNVHESRFEGNENFEFSVGGHFARVNISGNVFSQNNCKTGTMRIWGMEKEMLIERNALLRNTGSYAVEFNIQSHTEKFGIVMASFMRNEIRDNRERAFRSEFDAHLPSSYAIAVRGVQLINVTRNVFSNPRMQFEFLAGVLTGTIKHVINVKSNWWGSSVITKIQERIFDFDDWNNYAIADFSPFLGGDSIFAGSIPYDVKELPLDLEKPLGGRLFQSITLKRRSKPYVVKSDLTVLPGRTLTIEEGVEMEFHPSVGLLVLGDMVARGTYEEPIIFRPISQDHQSYRHRRSMTIPHARLCVDEACTETRRNGFLELYNTTTLQWVPVCDPRFGERDAQVICHELGFNRVNVLVKRDVRLDITQNHLNRVRSWMHPLACNGDEESLSQCEERLNGYSESMYSCGFEKYHYVFVYCGEENRAEKRDYWGGIRFSIPNFERQNKDFTLSNRFHFFYRSSAIRNVMVEGAGMLHGEKTAAIQVVMRDITLEETHVAGCASHGVEVIAPPGSLYFTRLLVQNNLGYGVNVLVLSGHASDENSLNYPLREMHLPHNVFGMVDICDSNKELVIEERVLLYYKYNNQPADCVKIFNVYNFKLVGFRLLHLNLFNSSGISSLPDSLRLFDGNIFNDSIPLLGEILVDNDTRREGRIESTFFKTTESTLSVQMHVSGGSGLYGFVAEVVTLPASYFISRELQHNISDSVIRHNILGAVSYLSAGESTPAVTVSRNRLDYNGQSLFGNLTTSEAAVIMDVQNDQSLYFLNNLVYKNQGGLSLSADSQSSVAALSGHILNNFFCENVNRAALSVTGRHFAGQYQRADISRNYFARNIAQYRDTVVLSQVISFFVRNLLVQNTGKHIVDVLGFEKVPQSYQTCNANAFWDNRATMPNERATILASNAGQRYFHNYFVNPENDFEMATANQSMFETRFSPINATYNWWGFNETTAVNARIRDKKDYPELLEVEVFPFYLDNSTVLSGKCSGGWQQIGETCFLYVGGLVTHDEAKHFCEMDNASLPYTKRHEASDLMHFVNSQQEDFDPLRARIWVQSVDISSSQCAILHRGEVVGHHCHDNLPFLCEKDPLIFVSNQYWYKDTIGIAALTVTSVAFFVVLVCLGFWFCKSRHKYQEKLERRNSIRASVRSNHSIAGSLDQLGYKRRLEKITTVESRQPKMTEFKRNGSLDSMEKEPSRFSSSVDDTRDTIDVLETRNSRLTGFPDVYGDRFAGDARLENANIDAMARPTFDLTYENHGYADRSMSRASGGEDVSRNWSSTPSGSTLDMKRSLQEMNRDADTTFGAPTPSNRSSSHDSYSTNSYGGNKQPLETAM